MWIRSRSAERERRPVRAFRYTARPPFRAVAVKSTLERLLRSALQSLPDEMLPAAARAIAIEVERTRDAGHGESARNVALRTAKAAARNPRELAQALVAALPKDAALERAEVAGPGFINFHLS